MNKTLIALALAAALCAAPALAAKDSARNELVYRTNLGRADDVKLLLSQDKASSPDQANEGGVPLIALAARRNDDEGLNIIKALLEAGADINKADPRGQTALFYAAKSGNNAVVEYLLAKKINYAATDRNGNTARNIAFQSDHNDIVELLDNFVRNQNDDMRKQYEDANAQLEERYRVYSEAMAQASRQARENGASGGDVKSVTVARIRQYARDISFSSCALAYWTFCSQARQPTELGTRGLSDNIESHRSRAISLSSQFVNTYGIDLDTIEKIATSSGGRVRNQLIGMQSNTARKEQGVGTIDDMNTRCTAISSVWNSIGRE